VKVQALLSRMLSRTRTYDFLIRSQLMQVPLDPWDHPWSPLESRFLLSCGSETLTGSHGPLRISGQG
jgi:hypothetical protein